MRCKCLISRFRVMIPIVSTMVGGCSRSTSQPTRLASDTIDLDEHRWKHRIVLVFAESDERPEFREFMGAWSREQENVKDRDLVVCRTLIKGTSRGPSGLLTPATGMMKRFLSPSAAARGTHDCRVARPVPEPGMANHAASRRQKEPNPRVTLG